MSRHSFRRYKDLLEKWPVEPTKYGRDYGEFLRKRFNELFPKGEYTQIEDKIKIEKEIDSLERLAKNTYFRPFGFRVSSATTMNADECKYIVSTDHLKENREYNERTIVDSFKDTLSTIIFKKN